MKRKTITIVLVVIATIAVILGFAYHNYQKNHNVVDAKGTKFIWMYHCDDDSLDSSIFDQTKYCECTLEEMQKVHSNDTISRKMLRNNWREMGRWVEPYTKTCIKRQGVDI